MWKTLVQCFPTGRDRTRRGPGYLPSLTNSDLVLPTSGLKHETYKGGKAGSGRDVDPEGFPLMGPTKIQGRSHVHRPT